MPFDTTDTTPTLQTLADILRDRSRWPEDFGPWNFSSCSQCAMGLAVAMWNRQAYPSCQTMTDMFGIPSTEASKIFCGSLRFYDTPRAITPEQIADRIETYLARMQVLVPTA